MKVTCSTCRMEIPASQINVATDVAFCPQCEEAYALSEMVASGEIEEEELSEPPKGCWFTTGFNDWEVGSTTRSYGAFFLVPFMCVWSGFSLGGIYGTQIVAGKFNLMMSLFGIPFLLGTLLFGSIAVMSVCGKVVVRVHDDDAELFAGVGPFGWRRRFRWSQIRRVEEGKPREEYSGRQSLGISLEGGEHKIRFGTMVSEERLHFLMRLLRRMLVKA